MKLKIGLTLILLGIVVGLQAQNRKFSTLSDADEDWVDNIFTQLIDNNSLNMASVGIIKDGRIVYLAGYGVDIIDNQVVGATACTNFRLASVAKLITATVAMQLIEEGKMSLSDDIRKFVPQYPDKGAVITIAHLLSHKAGLDTLYSFSQQYYNSNNFFNPEEAVALFKNKPLIPGYPVDSDNGYGFYSNIGYSLLAAAIEKAGEAPFSQQVYERICRPLDLPYLSPEFKWDEPNKINLYNTSMNKITPNHGNHLEYLSSGGYIGSAIDLTLLAQAFIKNKVFDSPSTLTEMSTLHAFIKNKNDMRYGYGMAREYINTVGPNAGKYVALGHAGGMEGGGASVFFLNNGTHKIGVAVMTNKTNATLQQTALQIMAKIPAMSVNSTTDFIPNDPSTPFHSYYHSNLPTFYGEKQVKNTKVPEFLSEMTFAGNEVELAPGFEVTASTAFEVRLVNQNRQCVDNSRASLNYAKQETSSKENNDVGDESLPTSSLSVFPNPTSGKFNIMVSEPENARIDIYSHYGQKVHQIDNLSNLNELNFEGKEAGFYIINLIKADGTIEYLRFLKQ